MSLKGWSVCAAHKSVLQDFIPKWHYSKSVNGCIMDYGYCLNDPQGNTKGAMFFGRMAMANQWKKYGDRAEDVIELRRLCCVDDTPKNAESFFIGRSLKLLKKEWNGKIVVSYADKEYGHTGIIYKASNFKLEGEIPGAKVIVHGDRTYHDKAIRTKYKGELKPFAKRLKDALDSGEAFYKKTAGKYVYTYVLRR